MSLKPLSGIRVLDLTAVPPGSMCTVMLADLGAEVVRLEPPSQKGKPSLVLGQVALSRGKRSITLDRRNPAANDVLKRLIASVDVVVENAKPGQMEAQGFGYSQARAVNPRIVWCAVTSFGQSGPLAEQSGHDLSFLAHSGLLAALSPELPWHPGVMIAGPAGAYAAVVGIQGALLQRERSGEGAFVDISLSEATTWLLTSGINAISDRPMAIPTTPDRRLYRCADGRYVAVASSEPRTWEALCDALDLQDLKDTLHKLDRAAEVTARLSEIFKARPAAEWVERLGATGATVHILNRAKELLEDPHVKARGSVVESAGAYVPATPVRITAPDGAAVATAVEAPHAVGQDTDEVLASAGFSKAEIEALAGAGVI